MLLLTKGLRLMLLLTKALWLDVFSLIKGLWPNSTPEKSLEPNLTTDQRLSGPCTVLSKFKWHDCWLILSKFKVTNGDLKVFSPSFDKRVIWSVLLNF